MTPREAEILVKELEKKAENDPSKYKTEVLLLALLGYFFLYGLFFGACIIFICSFYAIFQGFNFFLLKVLLLLISSSVIFALYKAMVFKIEEPEGLELPRQVSPLLYKDIREIRIKTKSPRIHQVLFNMDFNACVDQHPRLGGLGFKKNYLIIGLPLLFGMSKEEFKSVIGHEMGHVSRRHGMFARWIFRLRKSLFLLYEHLESKNELIIKRIITPFFKWYMPYFNAYSFHLSRRHEFEADKIAAQGTDPELTGQALCKVETLGLYLERHFYRDIDLKAVDHDRPPVRFLSHFIQVVKSTDFLKNHEIYLNKAYAQITDFIDTHPSLQDRLRALNVDKKLILKNQVTAAKHYFARDTKELVHALDGEWLKAIAPFWKKKHEIYKAYLEKLEKFEALRKEGEILHEIERWQVASLTETCYGPAKALPKFRRYHSLFPEKSEGIFAVGRILLEEKGDPKGVEMLDRILGKDPFFFEAACRQLMNYYLEKGDEKTAMEYKERLLTFHDDFEEMSDERIHLRKNDEYEHHGLEEKYLESIYSMLSRYPFIKRAWILKKKVKYFEKTPMHILVFATRFLNKTENRIIDMASQNLETFCYVPGTLSVTRLSVHRHLRNVVKKMKETQVYSYRD